MHRAGPKNLMLLEPSVFAAPFLQDFGGYSQKLGDSGSKGQNTTDEPKVMKQRGDTELSDAFLGRHLTVCK